MPSTKHPLVLTILDGWGYRAETANNAIALARKPTYDKLLKEFPNTLIRASEHFVGLPDGQMGNSEVGHLNIGAGRIVQMDASRASIPADCERRVREESERVVAGDAARARRRTATAFVRACIGRRRAFAPGASLRAAAHCARERRGQGVCACVHGRTRYGADFGCGLYCAARAERCGSMAWARWPASTAAITQWIAIPAAGSASAKAYDAMVNGKAEGGVVSERRGSAIKENYNSGTTDEFPDSVCGNRCGGQARRADSRRRRVHQLLPRRPCATDYAGAGARERPGTRRAAATWKVGSRSTKRSRAARFPKACITCA